MPDSSGKIRGITVPSVPWHEVRCQICGEWSAEDEWDYHEQSDPPEDDYEWWWTCPRCGAETPNFPEAD